MVQSLSSRRASSLQNFVRLLHLLKNSRDVHNFSYISFNSLLFDFQLMSNIHSWGTDLFLLNDLTNSRPLTSLTYAIFQVRLSVSIEIEQNIWPIPRRNSWQTCPSKRFDSQSLKNRTFLCSNNSSSSFPSFFPRTATSCGRSRSPRTPSSTSC